MSLQKLVVGPAESVEYERSERARAQVRRVKAEYPGNRSNVAEADRQVVAQASKRVGEAPLSEILAEVEQFGVNLEKLAIMLLDEGETLAKAACEFANSDVGRLARGTVLKLEMDFGDVLFEGLATMIQEGGMGSTCGLISGSLERLERLAEVDDEQSEPRRSIGWLVRPKFDDGARGNRPKGGSHD